MPANLGKLNKKVDIVSGVAGTFDGFETVKDKILYSKIWASVEPGRGSEKYERDKIRNDTQIKITIRHRSNIDEGCKVIYLGKIFEIKSICDPSMEHDVLELYCVEQKRGNTSTGNKLELAGEWSE